MKIYTKVGDQGETSLFGGKITSKDDIRIEAYGTIDELNACIGVLTTTFQDGAQFDTLTMIQNRLFTIGSNLASDPNQNMITPDVSIEDISFLEEQMDEMDMMLDPLTNFILPGGSPSVAHGHVCRTVTRRAERRVVSLSHVSEVDPKIIIYLNRLSDYFFVLSRYLCKIEGIPEVKWISRN